MTGFGFSPEPGDFLWCRFPYKENIGPGLKPRPALVLAVMDERTPLALRIAYGTSRGVLRAGRGEILIDEACSAAYDVAGLSRPTRISLRHVVVVPFTADWFPNAPGRRSCKLGTLHPSLLPRLRHAAQEAGLFNR